VCIRSTMRGPQTSDLPRSVFFGRAQIIPNLVTS
jgi:hypothetical protein